MLLVGLMMAEDAMDGLHDALVAFLGGLGTVLVLDLGDSILEP